MKKSVSLKIQGKTYQVKTNQDSNQLQMLADLVEKRMNDISDATVVKSTLDLAILALLNMAKDLYDSEKNREELEKLFDKAITRSIEKVQNEIHFTDSF